MIHSNHFSLDKTNDIPSDHEVKVAFHSEDDVKLWEKFKSGDKMAFTIIYNKHISHLYNFCFQFSRDKEISEDIIHDVFLSLRISGSKTKIRSIKSYLFRCAYTEWIKKKKKNKLPDIDAFEFIVLSIEDKIIEDQEMKYRLEDLKERMTLLTTQQKKAVLLFYYEGMSYDEVAEVLLLKNAKSARKLIYRALDRLRSKDSKSTIIQLFCM
ncbi:RNA polymerase sigma factor [Ekhidna sp.]